MNLYHLDIIWVILILSTFLLCFYYLYFFKKIVDHQDLSSSKKLPVSVVICAKNEVNNLRKHLPSILAQDYPLFEVLVIVDHSHDGSFEYLQKQALNYAHLKVMRFEEDKISAGKKEALSFGIKNATNEHILLTDADCYPASDQWIKDMTAGFSTKSELVLGIGLYDKSNNRILSQIIQWDTLIIAVQYLSFSLRGKTYMSVGRNVAYTKSLFNKTDGFTTHLHINSGDDDLFVQEASEKTATSVVIKSTAHTYSSPNTTWRNYLQQKSRHLSTGSRYQLNILLLLGLFQFCILSFYCTMILGFLENLNIILLLAIFLIKNCTQASVFRRIFFKIGVSVPTVPFLIFDIVWVLMITFTNLKRMVSANNKW